MTAWHAGTLRPVQSAMRMMHQDPDAVAGATIDRATVRRVGTFATILLD